MFGFNLYPCSFVVAETTSVEINTMVSQFRYFFLAAFTMPLFSKKWKIHGMKSSLNCPVILSLLLIAWGLNPGRPGFRSDRLPRDNLPYHNTMVNIFN
jgi:hypothetical protein